MICGQQQLTDSQYPLVGLWLLWCSQHLPVLRSGEARAHRDGLLHGLRETCSFGLLMSPTWPLTPASWRVFPDLCLSPDGVLSRWEITVFAGAVIPPVCLNLSKSEFLSNSYIAGTLLFQKSSCNRLAVTMKPCLNR